MAKAQETTTAHRKLLARIESACDESGLPVNDCLGVMAYAIGHHAASIEADEEDLRKVVEFNIQNGVSEYLKKAGIG